MPARKQTTRPAIVAEPTPWTVQASVFKATCLELMDEVQARGTTLVVTKSGRPVVMVAPASATPPSPIGFLAGSVIGHADLVGPEHEAWRASDSDPVDGG